MSAAALIRGLPRTPEDNLRSALDILDALHKDHVDRDMAASALVASWYSARVIEREISLHDDAVQRLEAGQTPDGGIWSSYRGDDSMWSPTQSTASWVRASNRHED